MRASSLPIISRGLNSLDVFGNGSDNAIYIKSWDGNNWSPSWTSLDGTFLTITDVVSWGPARMDVFSLGTDRRMYQKSYNKDLLHFPPLNWNDWQALGTRTFKGPPSVSSWGPNRLDAFGIGFDNGMYHNYWDGHQWLQSDWEALGGTFISAPSVVSWGPNRLDIFVIGTDEQAYHKAWDGSNWLPSATNWEQLGGQKFPVSSPVAISWGSNRLDFFAVNDNGQLCHKAWDGSKWLNWETWGDKFVLNCWGNSWGPNRLDIFAQDADEHGGTFQQTWHKAWDGNRWLDWELLGGALYGGDVASWGPNRLDIVGIGPGFNAYHKAWDGNNWLPGGTDWEPLGTPLNDKFVLLEWYPSPPPPPPCGVPGGLASSNVTWNSATISWGAVAGATSYALFYKISTSETVTYVNPITGTSCNLEGLSASTDYICQVQALCQYGGVSPYCPAFSFTTSPICGTPGGLTVSKVTSNSATVSWSAVQGATSYSLAYKGYTSETVIYVNGITGTSCNLTGLSAGINYVCQVQAKCPNGVSPYSSQLSFITLGGGQTTQEISVSNSGSGTSAKFTVTGSGFHPNATITIWMVDNATYASNVYTAKSDGAGHLNYSISLPCISGTSYTIHASDGRPDGSVGGVVPSNYVPTSCP